MTEGLRSFPPRTTPGRGRELSLASCQVLWPSISEALQYLLACKYLSSAFERKPTGRSLRILTKAEQNMSDLKMTIFPQQ